MEFASIPDRYGARRYPDKHELKNKTKTAMDIPVKAQFTFGIFLPHGARSVGSKITVTNVINPENTIVTEYSEKVRKNAVILLSS